MSFPAIFVSKSQAIGVRNCLHTANFFPDRKNRKKQKTKELQSGTNANSINRKGERKRSVHLNQYLFQN